MSCSVLVHYRDAVYYTKYETKNEDKLMRTVEGTQWNIDKCIDELSKLQKDKRT